MQKINGTRHAAESCTCQPDVKGKTPLRFPCMVKYFKSSAKIGGC